MTVTVKPGNNATDFFLYKTAYQYLGKREHNLCELLALLRQVHESNQIKTPRN